MGISQGSTSLTLGEILDRVSEAELLAFYLGITKVPIVICSPIRTDNKPSFGLYSPDGRKIRYRDFATGETGGMIDLLQAMWKCSFIEVLGRIVKDNPKCSKPLQTDITTEHKNSTTYSGDTKLEVKIREWRQYDLDYWNTFGIPLKLLKAANVHPISHYIITKHGRKMIFGADKLAYAYVEFKEGNVSIKVYQPYNKSNFKWISKHDRSVLGLWTLLPPKGKIVCICSSVKDALCLMAHTHIPCICLQGEAYNISETAQTVLKERFENVCVLLDSDTPGKQDAERLVAQTGFTNIELPESSEYKDVAELYTILQDPIKFKEIIISLFKQNIKL